MNYCSHELNESIFKSIDTYNLSTKRTVYAIINDFEHDELANIFIPALGITFGEFCVHHVVTS